MKLSASRPASTLLFATSALAASLQVPVIDNGYTMLVAVKFGSSNPVTNYLAVDTGSTDIWTLNSVQGSCVSTPEFCNTSNSLDPSAIGATAIGGRAFKVAFMDATSATGGYFNTTVGLGDLSVPYQQIGVANKTNTNGYFGIGYHSEEAYYPKVNYTTFPEHLVEQGVISSPEYSIAMSPASSSGVLIFGGPDSSYYSGELTVLPNLEPYTEDRRRIGIYGSQIVVSGVDKTFSLSSTAMEIDTGSSFDRFPSEIIGAIVDQTGALYDSDNEYYVVSSSVTLPNITITLAGSSVPLVLNSYVLGLNSTHNILALGESDAIVLGMPFLRQYYVHIDQTNVKVGIAPLRTPESTTSSSAVPSSTMSSTASTASSTFTTVDPVSFTSAPASSTTPLTYDHTHTYTSIEYVTTYSCPC